MYKRGQEKSQIFSVRMHVCTIDTYVHGTSCKRNPGDGIRIRRTTNKMKHQSQRKRAKGTTELLQHTSDNKKEKKESEISVRMQPTHTFTIRVATESRGRHNEKTKWNIQVKPIQDRKRGKARQYSYVVRKKIRKGTSKSRLADSQTRRQQSRGWRTEKKQNAKTKKRKTEDAPTGGVAYTPRLQPMCIWSLLLLCCFHTKLWLQCSPWSQDRLQ